MRRVWGWRLAVPIIAIQVVGDVVNVFIGDLARGAVGVAIASALLIYLVNPKVRIFFSNSNVPRTSSDL